MLVQGSPFFVPAELPNKATADVSNRLSSNMSYFSKSSKKSIDMAANQRLEEQLNSGHGKPSNAQRYTTDIRSEIYISQDQFRDKERKLSDYRLRGEHRRSKLMKGEYNVGLKDQKSSQASKQKTFEIA